MFLTADGSRESHAVMLATGEPNRSPRAGKPYRQISWGDIRRMVDSPSATEKDDAPFVVLSTYVGCDGRTHDVQRERGVFGGLAVDIDKGNPTLSEVRAAVEAVTGGAQAEIYSSSSASPDVRKWRVLIPLATPVCGADYLDTQNALFGLLAAHGLTCDHALARAAQPVYLPNVPPARRGRDGQPLFYQSAHVDGSLLKLVEGSAVVDARTALRSQQAADEAAMAARSEAYRVQRAAYVAATGDDFDPIAHYNAAHTIESALVRYGFERRKGGKGAHYRSPLSTSGSFSTEDRGDHWITVSAWAHDHNIGRPTRNGNRYGTAFDLLVAFEHKGDVRAAIRAYAAECGQSIVRLDDVVPVVVEQMPDRGPARSLDEWRDEMGVERALALRMPGLHLDRSPTGSGKTTATTKGIVAAIESTRREAAFDDSVVPITSTLTALPDHANIRERVREMQAAGIPAVAYPERNETTCGNLEAVRRAEGLGLAAGAAVCWQCPLNDSCLYNKQKAVADKAAHVLCTHERLRRSAAEVADGKHVIVIDETPEVVLAPSLSVRVDDFAPFATLARTVRDDYIFCSKYVMEPDPEQRAFAAALVEAYDLIAEAARDATEPGVVEIPLPPVAGVPKNWQSMLLQWAVQIGISPGRERHKQARFANAVRLLTMIVTGQVERLNLLVSETNRHEKQADGTVREWNPLHHFVVGSWKTRLPDVPILCLDATADADGLRAATGLEVHDCTPTGHLPNVAPVVQVPFDVTAGASPTTAAGFVMALLDAHPEIRSLGVGGHQDHIRAMMTDDTVLPARYRERVKMHAYYGQGPDRGSNAWYGECDAGILVGTLRPGGGAVAERLVNRGQVEAARRDGRWGVRHWDAVTTDGRPIRVEGKGYHDPEWHAAHVSISRAAMIQFGGRWRSILEDGKPLWIVSDEPMGVPVDDSLEVVAPVVREAVEAVRAIRDGGAGTELFPIRDTYRRKFGSQVGVRVSAVVEMVRAMAGKMGKKLGQRAIEKRLALARHHGHLETPEGGKGWLVVPADAPVPVVLTQSLPVVALPAVVAPTAPAVVIRASAPQSVPTVDIVAAAPVLEAVTLTCTTASMAPFAPDDLLMEVEERAAIMENDGGLDRETADRLALEMRLGRDGSRGPVAQSDIAAADHVGMEARGLPYAAKVLRVIPGTVRVAQGRPEPRPPAPATAGPVCGSCGRSQWVEVLIHDGASTRIDCGHCDRFGWHSVWRGVPCGEGTPGRGQPGRPVRATQKTHCLSFIPTPLPPTPEPSVVAAMVTV